MRGLIVGLFLGLLTTGCAEGPPPSASSADEPIVLAGRFEPESTGTISGQVVWNGDVPDVPPLRIWPLASDPPGFGRWRSNPNAPLISPSTHGVANTVVFLRGVDPQRSRPWDHPPVRVVLRDYRIDVCQGEACGLVGFVCRGEAVEMVSTQPVLHMLRAGGAAFWTVPFPDPDQPLTRRLTEHGMVELSSGAGFFWMRGYLLVTDHPYVARTDADGRFSLPQVPPGRYELVCWLPNWHVSRQERDPETMRVARVQFAPPVEVVQTVTVDADQTTTATVMVNAAAF